MGRISVIIFNIQDRVRASVIYILLTDAVQARRQGGHDGKERCAASVIDALAQCLKDTEEVWVWLVALDTSAVLSSQSRSGRGKNGEGTCKWWALVVDRNNIDGGYATQVTELQGT